MSYLQKVILPRCRWNGLAPNLQAFSKRPLVTFLSMYGEDVPTVVDFETALH